MIVCPQCKSEVRINYFIFKDCVCPTCAVPLTFKDPSAAKEKIKVLCIILAVFIMDIPFFYFIIRDVRFLGIIIPFVIIGGLVVLSALKNNFEPFFELEIKK